MSYLKVARIPSDLAASPAAKVASRQSIVEQTLPNHSLPNAASSGRSTLAGRHLCRGRPLSVSENDPCASHGLLRRRSNSRRCRARSKRRIRCCSGPRQLADAAHGLRSAAQRLIKVADENTLKGLIRTPVDRTSTNELLPVCDLVIGIREPMGQGTDLPSDECAAESR